MLIEGKTMPNRSYAELPSFYVYAEARQLDARRATPYPLEVYDITYMHFHSALELGVCMSGKGTCIVEGREYAFCEGDVQVIFPFQRHLSRSEGGGYSQWIWTYVNPLKQLGEWGVPDMPRLERLLYTHMALCGIIDRARHPLAAELVRRVTLPGEASARLACLHALIEELAAESAGLEALTLRPEHAFVRLEPALRHVQQALDSGSAPAVSGMARACAMSPATLRREFVRVMGRSPRRYIQSCQLQKAGRLLLMSGEAITQIAQEVGYQDVSGFNRAFMSAFGITPREYRRLGGVSLDGDA